MDHESVLDVINDKDDDSSDYEYRYEDDVEEGQLRSGFQAMDIAEAPEEGEHEADGIPLYNTVFSRLGARPVTDNSSSNFCYEDVEGGVADDPRNRAGRGASTTEASKGTGGLTKSKKRNHKRKQSRQGKQGNQVISIDRFVVETCRRLGETKYPLFREAVDRLGIEAIQALVAEVDVIEKCGGQMTANGARRRTAAGVLWNILRDRVDAVMFKEIMKEGNKKLQERQREKQKERGPPGGKRHLVHGNERQHVKRQRTEMEIDRPCTPRPPRPPREPSREKVPATAAMPGEADNLRTPLAAQNAWIQGLKMHLEQEAPAKKDAPGSQPAKETDTKPPVSGRIRMPVSYEDLVEEGEVAISPVNGKSEVDGPGFESALVPGATMMDPKLHVPGGLNCEKEDGEIDEEAVPLSR